jgi:hypothetical protein
MTVYALVFDAFEMVIEAESEEDALIHMTRTVREARELSTREGGLEVCIVQPYAPDVKPVTRTLVGQRIEMPNARAAGLC